MRVGRRVKISRRMIRGRVAYVMNVPKALMDLLGGPEEVVLSLGIKDGKQVVIMEPVQPSKPQGGHTELER